MRRALAVLLLLPLAQAAPGHDGPEPAEVVMHIHFAGEDRLPMQPMAPNVFSLPPAAEPGAECGSSIQWLAVFTQVPVAGDVVWTAGLARDAHLGPTRPVLQWYVEMVHPGTGDPLPVPAPEMRLQADLRAGGRVLAHATVDAVPAAVAVEDRSVHRYNLPMAWENRTILKEEGLELELRLDMGPDACRVAPPGVRAYGDPEHSPRLLFDVFEPVRIDRLEPVLDAGTIVWHASSPWGRFDLQQPDAPTIRGPGGATPAPVLLTTSDASVLETVWAWQPGPNGTYRIDAVARNLAGNEALASAVFRVGDDARPAPVQEAPGKESPLPALLPVLVLAGFMLRTKR